MKRQQKTDSAMELQRASAVGIACRGRGLPAGRARGLAMSAGRIEIDLGGSRRVLVDAGVDRDAIARLLKVLNSNGSDSRAWQEMIRRLGEVEVWLEELDVNSLEMKAVTAPIGIRRNPSSGFSKSRPAARWRTRAGQ